uniref:uncharacterized protein LOC122593102 n=1 Tax=Erigeron canadensis TaxID=72917 RepID=UPI001CB8E2FB|nr:uncharacterized protein LOC122593102 [Erigeron canadensis]
MANEFQSLIGEDAFESVEFDVVSDSESWQVVGHSDSDDGDVITTDDDVITTDDDATTTIDDEESEGVPDVDDLIERQFGSPVSDISVKSLVDEIAPIHSQEEVKPAYLSYRKRQMIGDYVAALKSGGLIDGVDDPYQITQEVKNVGYEIGNSLRVINDCYNEEEESEDSDVEEDDNSDLDDELVPKWLSNKFERQRMRKLGKRVYPKMKKSKRMVNQYNKPGCVHGKHGLGLKHNLIY